MIVLGIESTAHTFGVGITKNKQILANKRDAFTTKSGGMIPFQVQKHHIEVCDQVLRAALTQANLQLKDIDLIAFSQGPGMGATLQVGAVSARTIAQKYKIPIMGVNHCIAHLTIGEVLSKGKDAVLLYASGANTQVIAYEGEKYRVFGETLDIGVGNFLDMLARHMGLGFPGGPKIAELAKKGKYIPLPYSVKGMDVSFGGLLTHCKKLLKTNSKEDVCFSVQECVFAMLTEVAERALAHTGKKELVLGGGVACNDRLQEMCTLMCKERGAKCLLIPKEFYVDNGAMIAMQGFVQYNTLKKETKDTSIHPYERTDDILVYWKTKA